MHTGVLFKSSVSRPHVSGHPTCQEDFLQAGILLRPSPKRRLHAWGLNHTTPSNRNLTIRAPVLNSGRPGSSSKPEPHCHSAGSVGFRVCKTESTLTGVRCKKWLSSALARCPELTPKSVDNTMGAPAHRRVRLDQVAKVQTLFRLLG